MRRRTDYYDIRRNPVDGIPAKLGLGVVRAIFELKHDGDSDLSYKPQPHSDGPICEQCWINWDLVRGENCCRCIYPSRGSLGREH